MSFTSTIGDLVRRRYSCRAYRPEPIAADLQAAFGDFLATDPVGPFGTRGRFELVAASEGDRAALKGLGTYGFIKDAPGFIVGAVEAGPRALEDYGFLLERAILRATDLDLGTCWLGGTFTRSRFARKISLARGELMPAVAAIGHPADGNREEDGVRRRAGSDHRLAPEALFFEGTFGTPLRDGGAYAAALEAVRWAPSASNRQPWRIVRTETGWHFFLERTRGYGKGSLVYTLMRLADLQRVDIGIAMCHFELKARENGLDGSWVVSAPSVAADGREYTATWRPARH